jgi:hypothetical protein
MIGGTFKQEFEVFHTLLTVIFGILLVARLVCGLHFYHNFCEIWWTQKFMDVVIGLIVLGFVSRIVADYRHGIDTICLILSGIVVVVASSFLDVYYLRGNNNVDDRLRHLKIYGIAVACCLLAWFASWQF